MRVFFYISIVVVFFTSVIIKELGAKWTYKTALGIAIESNNNETHEVICVVETNKILLKNDKENEKKGDI